MHSKNALKFAILAITFTIIFTTGSAFAEESSDVSTNELVDEYLRIIEKLDNVATRDDLVVTQELINELNDELDRLKETVIQLQKLGYDGEANAERIGKQMVGIITFYDKQTKEMLFEIQIPNGTMSIFTSIGLINEFENEGIEFTFEQKTELIKSGLALLTGITTFEDEGEADKIASHLIYGSIGAFHPSVDNEIDDNMYSIDSLKETIAQNSPFSPKQAFAATGFSEMTDEELIDRFEELVSSGSDYDIFVQDAMDKYMAGEIDKADLEAFSDELWQKSTQLLSDMRGIAEELRTRGYEVEAGVSTTDGLKPMITISKPSLTNDIKSPRMQVKQGIAPSDVNCDDGLELVFKISDKSPACVKPNSVEKLIQRGWLTPNLV